MQMALTMWLTGAGDSIFWGTVAFLLNYVPILGTVVGAVIFLFAGLLTIDTLWQALLPVGLYLAIHVIEGETVTPMLLAKPVHPQPRPRCRLACFLVVDVGCPRRDPVCALAGYC